MQLLQLEGTSNFDVSTLLEHQHHLFAVLPEVCLLHSSGPLLNCNTLNPPSVYVYIYVCMLYYTIIYTSHTCSTQITDENNYTVYMHNLNPLLKHTGHHNQGSISTALCIQLLPVNKVNQTLNVTWLYASHCYRTLCR